MFIWRFQGFDQHFAHPTLVALCEYIYQEEKISASTRTLQGTYDSELIHQNFGLGLYVFLHQLLPLRAVWSVLHNLSQNTNAENIALLFFVDVVD
jgi:hypothetical protein